MPKIYDVKKVDEVGTLRMKLNATLWRKKAKVKGDPQSRERKDEGPPFRIIRMEFGKKKNAFHILPKNRNYEKREK